MRPDPASTIPTIVAVVGLLVGGSALLVGDPVAWGLVVVGAGLLFATTSVVLRRLQLGRTRRRLVQYLARSVTPMALTERATGRLLEVNEAFLAGARRTRQEVVGRTTFDLGVFPDAQRRREFLEGLDQGRTLVELEMPGPMRVLCAALPLELDGQEYVFTQFVDLTAMRRDQEARDESAARLRLALEGSLEELWDWRPQTHTLHVGERAHALLGCPPGAFPDDEAGWAGRIHPDDRVLLQANLPGQLHVGRVRVELRLRRQGGEYGVFLVRGQVTERDTQGHAARVVGTLVDISARWRAEEELRAAYQHITDILESTSDGFLTLDAGLVVRSFNRAAERLLGRERREVVGRALAEAFPELAGSVFELRFREALTEGHPLTFETHIAVKPYENWYDVRVFPIREGLSVFFRVTTERRRLEEQLLQAQKMEAIGRLAGGVAHDFNNQLAAIMGYDELILRDLPEGHSARPRAELIRKAAERAAGLTRQLLAFGRRQALEPQLLNLNTIVADVSELLRRTIGEDISLSTALAPDLGLARLDRAQVEQALLGLVVNARDSMPHGGQLTIETRNATLDAAYCARHLNAQPGEYVLLALTDTGTGMDPTTLARLFEPFFTTKEFGKGTGLGLAMVYGVVTQSGGHIAVESTPGQGSCFQVYLPRVEAQVASAPSAVAAPPAASPSPAFGGETILVVEDEPVVRRLIVEVLRASGYRVLEAADGEDGRSVSEQHAGVIHLLVTDVVMPTLGGQALAEILGQARPGLRVLFMSGHAEDALGPGSGVPAVRVLAKPFTPTTLVKRVREVLVLPPPSNA